MNNNTLTISLDDLDDFPVGRVAESTLVSAKFQSKKEPKIFSGREYNYYCNIEVSVGDIVILPSANGESKGLITAINVPENTISECIMPLLKTIYRKYESEENENGEQE